MSSLRSTGLQPGPTKEERQLLHAGVSSDLSPILFKVVSFLLCIALLPYGAHKLVSALTTVPTMLDAEEGTILPAAAAFVTLNAVIFGFIWSAAQGDRRKLAEEEKRTAEAKKEK